MGEEIFDLQKMASFKRKFSLELRPIMEMLTHYKSKMKADDWSGFVERTKLSITAHPNQYLQGELPSSEVLSKVVFVMFEEYIKSESM